jgi:peptide chain release factor 3
MVHGPHGWLWTISLTRLLTGRGLRSDWMAVERERGISVSSAVMSFEHERLAFNLLDTPGHQDFSPMGFGGDTYRTLTAVDSAVMVLDAAPNGAKGHRGADPQALRGLPLARRADHHLCQQARPRGPRPVRFVGQIEQSLALDVTPASWPIGMGRDFLGTWDRFADALLLFERGVHDRVTEPVRCSGLDDPKLPRLLPKPALAKLREEVEMVAPAIRPAGPADLYESRESSRNIKVASQHVRK